MLKRSFRCFSGKEVAGIQRSIKEVSQQCGVNFNELFQVPSYWDTLKINYQKAIEYLETWHPDTNLQIEIDSWNGLEVVY